jgi:hypothetical protein
MRILMCRYLIALSTLLIFLLSGQASVLGYVWCLGERGHSELESISNKGCGSDQPWQAKDCHDDIGAVESHSAEDHCGPCVDFYIQIHDVKTSKKLKSISPVSIDTFSTDSLTSLASPAEKMVVGNLASQPPPRISSHVLTHRTVVLLI